MDNTDYKARLRQRVHDVANPDVNYTQADFEKEFESIFKHDINTFKAAFKFENQSTNPNPEYATSGSSGFDLRANLDSPIVLQPLERKTIPTGLFFEIPDNFEIQVRPRSGLAAKYGITVLNTPGTIDSDYRGEIIVILINLGNENFSVSHGDRIAQGVIATVVNKTVSHLIHVDKISDSTERSSGRFGHTGVH